MVQLRQLLVDYLIRASKEAVKVVGEKYKVTIRMCTFTLLIILTIRGVQSILNDYIFYNGAKSNTVSFYT